jgi:hypothetical protein
VADHGKRTLKKKLKWQDRSFLTMNFPSFGMTAQSGCLVGIYIRVLDLTVLIGFRPADPAPLTIGFDEVSSWLFLGELFSSRARVRIIRRRRF